MNDEIKVVRQLLASMPDSSGKPIEERRKLMELASAAAHIPEGIAVEAADAGGTPAEWLRPEGAPADRTILYLHGGGYTMGSLVTHRQMVACIAKAAAVSVLSLDYRLAPEHPFPAAVEDAAAAYRLLLKQGFAPEKIAIAGDSAGGGLTMATLVMLRDSGDPLPAAAICLSPLTDLTCSSETYSANAATEAMIAEDMIKEMAAMYLQGRDPKTPLASPIFADLTGFPPILIQVGSEEVLLGDSLALDRKAKACGVDSTLEIWQDMIHVWQAFSPILTEGRDAIARIGEFYRTYIR